jgi:multiple sugar transport system permease protein
MAQASDISAANPVGRSARRWNQRTLAPWLFLAPGLFMFTVYVIAPILEAVWISFYDWDGLAKKTWLGIGDLVAPPINFLTGDGFAGPFWNWIDRLNGSLIWLVLFMLLVSRDHWKVLIGLFAAFFGALFIFEVLFPALEAIGSSDAADPGPAKSAQWVGLGNYKELITDPAFETSLWNNLKWLILYMLALPFGLFIAIFLNQTVRGIRLYKSLFFFPFVISQVVVGLIFAWFYAPNFGLFYLLTEAVTGKGTAILADPDLVTYGIIAAGLWPQIAYVMILYLTGLNNVAPDQIEAARLDGAKGWRMLWYVVLPQLRPATFIAVIVTVIGALRSFDLVSIMTNGGPFGSSRVLSYYMYEKALGEYGFRMGYGAAIAVVLFAIMMIFISGFIWKMWRDEAER